MIFIDYQWIINGIFNDMNLGRRCSQFSPREREREQSSRFLAGQHWPTPAKKNDESKKRRTKNGAIIYYKSSRSVARLRSLPRGSLPWRKVRNYQKVHRNIKKLIKAMP